MYTVGNTKNESPKRSCREGGMMKWKQMIIFLRTQKYRPLAPFLYRLPLSLSTFCFLEYSDAELKIKTKPKIKEQFFEFIAARKMLQCICESSRPLEGWTTATKSPASPLLRGKKKKSNS